MGLVLTMGALHEGHAALVRTARHLHSDAVVHSIFVNPLQFGPAEDLARYLRTWEADLGVCAVEGVDVVFAPEEETVYPTGPPQVSVDPGPLGLRFEGSSRPTHFRGVLTVVAKLLGLVRPDLAVFGEKDYQQLVLVRQMVEDLCLGVEVVAVETVRAADGLAVSSRNRYLQGDERSLALGLSRALRAGVEAGGGGAERVLSSALDILRSPSSAGLVLDYLDLVAPDLGPVPRRGQARLLLAAKVGYDEADRQRRRDVGPITLRPSVK